MVGTEKMGVTGLWSGLPSAIVDIASVTTFYLLDPTVGYKTGVTFFRLHSSLYPPSDKKSLVSIYPIIAREMLRIRSTVICKLLNIRSGDPVAYAFYFIMINFTLLHPSYHQLLPAI